MNIDHLQTFLTVVTHGNITDASKFLFVPQPTVSNRIQYLEEQFGQQLFVRGKRGVSLTKAGEMLLPYVQQVIDTISTAMSALNAGSDEGNFRLASTIPFTYPLIFERISVLSSGYPDLNIVLLNVDQSSVTEKLMNNEIDTALVIEPIIHKGIECHKIGQEDMKLIMSPDHYLAGAKQSIRIKDLENENLICYEPYIDNLGSHILVNINNRGRLITTQIGVVKQFLKQNQGISFLPPFTVKNEIEEGELVCKNIEGKCYLEPIEYYLVCRTNERYYEEVLLMDMTADIFNPRIVKLAQ